MIYVGLYVLIGILFSIWFRSQDSEWKMPILGYITCIAGWPILMLACVIVWWFDRKGVLNGK